MSNRWMDPEFMPLIKTPRPVLNDANLVREASIASRQPMDYASFDLEVNDLSIPFSTKDARQIPLRIYRPKSIAAPLPALLYLHGGGFFCGDLFSEQWQCAHYAAQAQCLVICVDYRLAPENPYPAALFDSYRVLEFLREQGAELGLDPARIAIGGSSAGANLAAAVALLARDRSGPGLCFQMLLIPALDNRLDSVSAREFTDVPDFATPEARVMWQWYLGDQDRDISPYATPVHAADLTHLPPAYVLCAGLDALRDDGLRYAQRLLEAGVSVELHLVPSLPHGFASISSAATSKQLLQEQVRVLQKAFQFGERNPKNR
ncbi:MAG: alpha/beta hydrolase [Acidobacteriaceae bacterium]|nr:alpha/beta hydrolase [Acidobacteriaceae bacterium]